MNKPSKKEKKRIKKSMRKLKRVLTKYNDVLTYGAGMSGLEVLWLYEVDKQLKETGLMR